MNDDKKQIVIVDGDIDRSGAVAAALEIEGRRQRISLGSSAMMGLALAVGAASAAFSAASAAFSPAPPRQERGRRQRPPIDIQPYYPPVPHNRRLAQWKGDGFDEERIAAAQAKRDRKAAKRRGRP